MSVGADVAEVGGGTGDDVGAVGVAVRLGDGVGSGGRDVVADGVGVAVGVGQQHGGCPPWPWPVARPAPMDRPATNVASGRLTRVSNRFTVHPRWCVWDRAW